MFFLYLFFALFILLTVFIMFTTIQISIQNIEYNISKDKKWGDDYKIIIKFYIFEKIQFFKLDIKDYIGNNKLKENFNKLENKIYNNKIKSEIKNLNILKFLKIEVKMLSMKVNLGLEDAGITAIVVGLFSAFIPIVLTKIKVEEKGVYWKIIPVYMNTNVFNIRIDSIIQLKLIHIINTIYMLKNKGGNKNGRTSNSANYVFSNE